MRYLIVISPAFASDRRLHGQFEAGSRLICRRSYQPLLDSARVLLGQGADPTELSEVAHAHDRVTLRGAIGEVARFDVKNTRFVLRPRNAVSGVTQASPIRFDARSAPDSGHSVERIHAAAVG